MKITVCISIDHEIKQRIKDTYKEPFSQIVEYALQTLLEQEPEMEMEICKPAKKQEPKKNENESEQTEDNKYLEWLLARKKSGKPIASIEAWKKMQNPLDIPHESAKLAV